MWKQPREGKREEEQKVNQNDNCKAFCVTHKRKKISRMAFAKLFALHANTGIFANFLTSLKIFQPVEILSHEGVSEFNISFMITIKDLVENF